MEVKTEKNYLTGIAHRGKEITFEYFPFKGAYGEVAEQIDKAGLLRPTSSQTASLYYHVRKNPKGKYEGGILRELGNPPYVWLEFTGNLFLPKSNEEVNNGVILEDNPTIINGELVMNKNSLIKRLYKSDPLVRFVSFGYKIGKQSSSELRKNPYILARYGEEGAEKIADIASHFSQLPWLSSFDSVQKEKMKISGLSIDFDEVPGLEIDCDGTWKGIPSWENHYFAFGLVP